MDQSKIDGLIRNFEGVSRREVIRRMHLAPHEPEYELAGNIVLKQMDADEAEASEIRKDRRHREIIRVAVGSAMIALVSAIIAGFSAWYAKRQADSAEYARVSAPIIDQK